MQLPTATSRITKIRTGNSAFVDEDKLITTTDMGNGKWQIDFSNMDLSDYHGLSNFSYNGSMWIEITVDTEGKEHTYYLITATGIPKDMTKTLMSIPTQINVVDEEKDTILDDSVSYHTGEAPYKVVKLSGQDCSGQISFNMLRTQGTLEPVAKGDQKAGYWMSIGCNYISVNGKEAQRFDADSRQSEGNRSEIVALQKGWNLVTLYTVSGRNKLRADAGGYIQ